MTTTDTLSGIPTTMTGTTGIWSKRMNITFNNTDQSEDLTDFPVLVKLTTDRLTYSDFGLDNGTDMRFIDSNNTAELDYEIELWNNTSDSFIWTKVPQIDGSSTTDFIYMYYGNPDASDGQDINNVWSNNYLVIHHMDRDPSGSAPQLVDSTGNANDGTSNGGMGSEDLVDALAGNGWDLDGSNDYVNISNLSGYGTDSVTVSMWLNANVYDGTYNWLWSSGKPGDFPILTLEVDASGNLLGRIEGDATSQKTLSSDGNEAGLGMWNYIVVVYNRTSDLATRYLNGSATGTVDDISVVTDTISTLDVSYIDGAFGRSEYCNGTIDEVRVANVSRSADWIAAQYLSMQDNFCTYVVPTPVDYITGTVFLDEGSSALANQNVTIAIDGVDQGTDQGDGSGVFNVTGLTLSAGDVITAYIQNETANGVTVSVSDGDNLTSFDIYQDYLITRHDNSGTLTNDNLSTADVGAETDISSIYAVAGSVLTTVNGIELLVPTGHSFTPGDIVNIGTSGTTSTLDVDGTLNASTGAVIDVFGNITSDGTFVTPSTTLNVTYDLVIPAGTFDNAYTDADLNIDGNVTMDNTITNMGDGTWTIGASFDYETVALIYYNQSLVRFTGTGNWLCKWTQYLYGVMIDDAAMITIPVGSLNALTNVNNLLIVNGTVSIPDTRGLIASGNCNVSVNAGGNITGAGSITLSSTGAGYGLVTMDGNITVGTNLYIGNPAADMIVVPATYDCDVMIESFAEFNTWTPLTGTYTMDSLTLYSDASGSQLTIENDANDTTLNILGDLNFTIDATGGDIIVNDSGQSNNWVIQGNVVNDFSGAGTLDWTKGTGTITLSGAGSGTQTIDFTNQSIEDILIDDTGATKQFTGFFTTDSFNATNGLVDFNGQTINSTGNFIMETGSNIVGTADAMDGATLIVGGNLDLDGTGGDKLTFNWSSTAWSIEVAGDCDMDYVSFATGGTTEQYLNVTGTPTASYVDVEYSNATGGTEINATDGTNTDNDNNDNWLFVIAEDNAVFFGANF